MKILIVDDKKENRYLLETLLKKHGHEVLSAANGEEALERIHVEGCDMIISDILMPIMDGFRLCQEVKKTEGVQHIPFVCYTATYTDEKDEEFALTLGADVFIRKPIEPDEFMKIIQGVIKQAEEGKLDGRRPVLEEEKDDFKVYSERLVQKLEKKMMDLEREITERKQAEKELCKERDFINTLLQSSPAFFVAINSEGKTLMMNQAMLDALGYTADEVIGTGFLTTFVLAADRKILTDVFGNITEEHQPTLIENHIMTRDEQNILVEWHGTPILKETGELDFFFGVGIDITERKQAEKELRRLRNLLSNIVNSMPSALVCVDSNGIVMQWNREAEKETGVTADKAKGHALTDVFPGLGEEMENVRQAILTCQVQKHLKLMRESGRETRFFDVTVYPLITNGAEGAVIRVDDVTEKVRMEEMMIQSEKILTVGGLAAGMAHEINNPLAGIIQNLQVMRDRVSADMPKNHSIAESCGTTMDAISTYMDKRGLFEIIELIMEAGLRAAKTVENMLHFSRKSEARFAPHDVCDLLDQSVGLASKDYDLKKRYDFRKVEIIRDYDAALPQVSCEGSQIQQVFLNIMKNGAQAMTEDRGQKTDDRRQGKPRLVLRVIHESDTARIEIEDNGPGMAEEVRKRVFEPFFTTKDVGIGTGLGLSVSYFIITENHGGAMDVESEPGKGTKFIIRLPFERNVT